MQDADENAGVARRCWCRRSRWRSRRPPDDWYKEGETQYNLGNFDKAADAFKQGFALETVESKKRRTCTTSRRRTARAEVQGRRVLLQALPRRSRTRTPRSRSSPRSAPRSSSASPSSRSARSSTKRSRRSRRVTRCRPTAPAGRARETPPAATRTSRRRARSTATATRAATRARSPTTPTVIAPPKLLISRAFTGGGAKISAGRPHVPMQATFALVAGYPVLVHDKLEIDARHRLHVHAGAVREHDDERAEDRRS